MIVISEDEDAEEDSSKQRRKISKINKHPTISLVQLEQDMEYDFDVSTVEGFTTSSVPITTTKLEISTTIILVLAGFEAAIRLQEQFDEEERQREEVVAKVNQAHDIDWSDPALLRYHAVKNKSFYIAEVRKTMCIYLKNQGGYKQSHFRGMSYEDIRPIFERVWDQNHAFVLKDSEIEREVMKRSGFDLQQESSKQVEEEIF
ncbi:hypothetical protein Tco_1281836 [Tanacetum coccineum]